MVTTVNTLLKYMSIRTLTILHLCHLNYIDNKKKRRRRRRRRRQKKEIPILSQQAHSINERYVLGGYKYILLLSNFLIIDPIKEYVFDLDSSCKFSKLQHSYSLAFVAGLKRATDEGSLPS